MAPNEKEQESIAPLKYQLRQWRKLIKYLPTTNWDRDDVAEIEKLVKIGVACSQDPKIIKPARRTPMEKDLLLTEKDMEELRECLELLHSIETIEYHNKNWLPAFAIKSSKALYKEKLALIQRAMKISGTSAEQKNT